MADNNLLASVQVDSLANMSALQLSQLYSLVDKYKSDIEAAYSAQLDRLWNADNMFSSYFNDIIMNQYNERKIFLEKFNRYEDQMDEMQLSAMMNILRVFDMIDVVVADDLLNQISSIMPTWCSMIKLTISIFQAQEHVHAHAYEIMFKILSSKYPIQLSNGGGIITDPQLVKINKDIFTYKPIPATLLYDKVATLYQFPCSNALELVIRQVMIEYIVLPVMLSRLDAVFNRAPLATGATFKVTNLEIAKDEKIHGSFFALLSAMLLNLFTLNEEWLKQLHTCTLSVIKETTFGIMILEELGHKLLNQYDKIFRTPDASLKDFDNLLATTFHGLYSHTNTIAIQSTGKGLYHKKGASVVVEVGYDK
jgi:ribonucleotide reductase beta subunit family protein with ferritin-like domain